MNKTFMPILLLVVACSLPMSASGQLNLSLQVSQFRFNPDTTLVEVGYGLSYPVDSLNQSSQAAPIFILSLTISQKNEAIVNNIWQMESQPAAADHQQVVIDVMKYLLPPGAYSFKLAAKNLSRPEVMDSVLMNNIEIRTFGTDAILLSDIQLAQTITPQSPASKDRFCKNNYRVLPNPLNVYTPENRQVYYYFELYNLTKLTANSYRIKRTVLDQAGLPSPSLPIYNKKKLARGDDAVEVGMFDVMSLVSGKYWLNFTLADSAGHDLVASATSFYVYNPTLAPVSRQALPIEQQMAGSEIALLSAPELELVLAVTRYFATPEETRIMTSLTTDQARRIFLFRFWEERDQDRSTPALETFREVMRRVQYANENFRETKLQGWQTDRGRVAILYGKPSLIQYYANVAGFREFQAWSYDDLERGVCFIFGVLGSFGDLKLLHSTKIGEKYNEYWLDLLKITSGATGVMDDNETGVRTRETYRDIFRHYNLELPRYLK
ncbi:MAG: GWxTD domain-containing protein [candidate division KSB1 bacterium]|nr:GWxTD domain-containing protein [candidate division KSB1 bacterium]MDZ7341644.1 GWxTD domain-containing protein [candidate division KSB1 bacterium]